MATVYYGGSGTDPLVRVEIVQINGAYSVTVTQVQATDTDAARDPDQNFYLGDLRGFYIDFQGAESGLQVANYKTYRNYDASGSGTKVALNGKNYKVGTDNVFGVGGSDNNMEGASSGGDGYDVGLEVGTAGMKGDDIGSISFTITGSSLSLDDLLSATFGIRATSVGLDANRDGDVSDSG